MIHHINGDQKAFIVDLVDIDKKVQLLSKWLNNLIVF